MRSIRALFQTAVLFLGLYATQASALVFVEDTTGSPTFNRALVDFSDLSAVGTDVAYDTFTFSVDTAGDYTFRSITLPLSDRWDNMLFLYQGSFDAGNALANGIAGSDDFNGNIGISGFDVALTTGVVYVLVTTGFENFDSGRYITLIRGAGDIISAVPEPETYAMLLSGLAVLAFLARRRRQS
jgi:PEP-CTERM motif